MTLQTPYRTPGSRPDLSETVASLLDATLARAKDARLARAAENARAKYIARLPLPWDPFVAAVATTLSRKPVPELVDLFIEQAGHRGAIDALIAASGVCRFFPYDKTPDDDVIDFCSVDSSSLAGGIPGLWAPLRRALRASSAESYAAARAHAEKLRATSAPAISSALAYAFPAEPWAAADLEKALAAKERYLADHLVLLLPSLHSPEHVERLCDTSLDFRVAFHDGSVEEAIARFGLRSLAFAKRLLMKKTGRPAVIRGLFALDESPEVIDLCVTVYSDSSVREPIRAFLTARPRLALPAITKASLKNKDQARLLSPLLATIVAKNRVLATELAAELSPKERALLESLGASEYMIKKCGAPIAAIVDAEPKDEAWTALSRWMHRGAPAKDVAKILDVARVADAAGIGRLAKLARVAAKNDGLACAMAIVDALEAVATPPAVREIARMTRELVDPLLSEHAEQSLVRLQARLGLSDDDMMDRAVPDYGASGPVVMLDFGPRAFRVELDGTLRPRLFDDKGIAIKSLPRIKKTDDQEKAKLASAHWATLRDEATALGKQQAARWETAMIEGRRWSASSFRDVILAHPILSHLAQRVVWMFESGKTFRVAEDLSLADIDDVPLALSPLERVRLAHVMELDAAAAAWGTVFTGYEIIQPFEQLGRSVQRLAAGTLKDTLAAFAGKPTRSAAAHHMLEERGWGMAFVGDDEALLGRTIRGREATARLRVPKAYGGWDELCVISLEIPGADEARDAILIAEVLRDLQAVTA